MEAMSKIEESKLPGVGVRHDFITEGGKRIGVISHRSGHRELLVYSDKDPDACSSTLRLEEDDSHTLVDLLGGSEVTAAQTALQAVDGLTIDWLPVTASSACADCAISQTDLRERTGATIIAVVRDEETIASPPPDFTLRPGDTAIAAGTADSLRKAFNLLRGG